MRKKALSILLVMVMVLSILPATTVTSNAATYGSGSADAMVNEALSYQGKTLAGVKDAMKKKGYSLWNESLEGDWCAWFVSNVAKNAGCGNIVGTGTLTDADERREYAVANNTVSKYGGTIVFVNQTAFNTKKRLYSSNAISYNPNYQPRKGDLVLFNWTSPTEYCNHIGIVVQDSSNPKSIVSVEGNTGNNSSWKYSTVQKKTRTGNTIVAYVKPKYKGTHPHTHDKAGGYQFYEAAHPHKKAYKCSVCGTVWADPNSSTYVSTCSSCNAKPGKTNKPTVSVSGSTVTVSWNKVANATSYNVYLVQAPWGTEDIKYSGNSTGTSYTFKNVKDGTYAAFVVSQPNDMSAQSEWNTFGVQDVAPSAPTIKLSREVCKVGDNITLSWNKVNNATSYKYYIADYPWAYAYTNSKKSGNITGTSVSFSDLQPGIYSMFVEAISSSGKTSKQSNWVTLRVYEKDYIPTKIDTYNGHLYALYDYPMQWTTAKELSEKMGGHLVTVTNKDENDFIKTLIASGSSDKYWLGATNQDPSNYNANGAYNWVTGETFSFTDWYDGEPSNSFEKYTKEHFLEIRKSYDNKWNDVGNSSINSNGFIIEYDLYSFEPTKVVKSGDSTYMLFDRTLPWEEAKAYCRLLQGGKLVNIESIEEKQVVESLIDEGNRSWYFMGGTRNGSTWTWTSGVTTKPVDKSIGEWVTDRDNDPVNKYLMMYKSGKKWTSMQNVNFPISDIDSIGFVCEIEENHKHSWDSDKTTTEATCEKAGVKTYTCSCGATKTEEVPALGHDYKTDASSEVAATCTKDGKKADQKCAWCDSVITGKSISATGHNWDTGKVTMDPTTDSEGVKTYTCNNCKETYTESIPKIDEPTPESTLDVVRIAGQTRYETSILTAKKHLELQKKDRVDTIIVATGENFADSLAGSYLAATHGNAPIIATPSKVNNTVAKSAQDKAIEFVANHLTTNGTVYILGGETAVPKNVERILKSRVGNVKRLAGSSRYETNIEILNEAGVSSADELLISTGTNFADSLSAASAGKPILLVGKTLTSVQKKFIVANFAGKKITVLGGLTAVNDEVYEEIGNYTSSIERIAGSTRYDTSRKIATKYFGNANKAVIAYGENFPDGLSGGPLAMQIGAPLLLADSSKRNAKLFAEYSVPHNIHSGYVLGGSGLVSDESARTILSCDSIMLYK